MRWLANGLRGLPFIVLFASFGAVWLASVGPLPPAPPPELPEALQLAPASAPARPAPPVPPEDGRIEGAIVAPSEVALGDPIELTLRMRNTGAVPLQNPIAWISLPDGTHTRGLSRTLRFSVSSLGIGESAEHTETLIAQRPGPLELTARFRSAEGVQARADALIHLSTAVLVLTAAPRNGHAGEESPRIEFELANVGGAPARDLLLRVIDLEIPPKFWRVLPAGETARGELPLFPAPIGHPLTTVVIEATATAADPARCTVDLTVP